MYRSAPTSGPLAIVAVGQDVFALDRTSGRPVWAFNPPSGNWSRLFVTDVTSPVSLDTVVLDGSEIVGGALGEVACHSTDSGQLLWHHRLRIGVGPVVVAFPGNSAQVDESV